MIRSLLTAAAVAALMVAAPADCPARARATEQPASVHSAGLLCTGMGWIDRVAGTACTAVSPTKTVITVGKKLAGGQVGGAVGTILGTGTRAVATVGLAAVAAWVTGGARSALGETATLVGASTRPDLLATWFSSTYWRVAGISALLTIPFLFAAAIQALLRGDTALLLRAAFGCLPVGMLAVGIAGPLTMMLLAASDEMSSIVSSAAGHDGATVFGNAGLLIGGIDTLAGSPFLAFFIGLLTVAAAVVLWLELLIREAAVYVIVLMLPLFFAAFVWPARRVWAVRAVELLVALVLSKFAIVAVLALGAAAMAHAGSSAVTTVLAGLTLVLLATFSPWALLRLLPMHEMASAVAGGLSSAPVRGLGTALEGAEELAAGAGALVDRVLGFAEAHRRNVPVAPAGGGDALGPGTAEIVEEAGEDAAAAVSGGGTGTAGTVTGSDAGTGAAGTAALPAGGDGAVTAEAREPQAPDPPHLAARDLDGMRDVWHRSWRPFELGPGVDADVQVDTLEDDLGPAPADPGPEPAAEPPTLMEEDLAVPAPEPSAIRQNDEEPE